MPAVGVARPVRAHTHVVPGEVERLGPFLRGGTRRGRAVPGPERLAGQLGDRWRQDTGLDGLGRDVDLAGRRQDGDAVLDVCLR